MDWAGHLLDVERFVVQHALVDERLDRVEESVAEPVPSQAIVAPGRFVSPARRCVP